MNQTGMIGKTTSRSIRHSIRRLHTKRSNPICRSAVKLRMIRNHPFPEILPLKRMPRRELKSIVSKPIKQEQRPRNHASLKVHQKASATIPGSRVKTLSMKSRLQLNKRDHILVPFVCSPDILSMNLLYCDTADRHL